MHEQSAADANNYAAAARQRLAQAGSDRLRDIFEDTLPDLRRQLMDNASDLDEEGRKRMFKETMDRMAEIAKLQEREVNARVHQETMKARELALSTSSGGSSGTGSVPMSSSSSSSSSSAHGLAS